MFGPGLGTYFLAFASILAAANIRIRTKPWKQESIKDDENIFWNKGAVFGITVGILAIIGIVLTHLSELTVMAIFIPIIWFLVSCCGPLYLIYMNENMTNKFPVFKLFLK